MENGCKSGKYSITYPELLFDEGDLIGYVTGDVWQDADGKWLPSKGVYDRTAGELIKSLKIIPMTWALPSATGSRRPAH